MFKPQFIIILIIASLILSACGDEPIQSAILAADPVGERPLDTFGPVDNIYYLVTLAETTAEAKAIWSGPEVAQESGPVEAEGTWLLFERPTAGDPWPEGAYQVTLDLAGTIVHTATFRIEAERSAVGAATPTATFIPPTPLPTLTPTPLPTSTPATAQQSTSSNPERDPNTAIKSEPLAFKPENYVHPSGAFWLPLPQGWEVIDEDAGRVLLSDGETEVGVLFDSLGTTTYDKDRLGEVARLYRDFVVGQFIPDDRYKTLLNGGNEADQWHFIALTSPAESQGDNSDSPAEQTLSTATPDPALKGRTLDIDLIAEQRGEMVFIIYLVTPRYAELLPTWDAIRKGYTVDAEKAAETVVAFSAIWPPPPTPTAVVQSCNAVTPLEKICIQLASGQAAFYISNSMDFELTIGGQLPVAGGLGDGLSVPVGRDLVIYVPPGSYGYYVNPVGTGDFTGFNSQVDLKAGDVRGQRPYHNGN